MIAKRVLFSGRVQGVGFRYTTREIATGFDVVGSVKNLADGTVEMEIMGEEDELREYLGEITNESPVAHFIKEVHTENIQLIEQANGFRIVR